MTCTVKEHRKAIVIYEETNLLKEQLWQFRDFLDPMDYPNVGEHLLVDKEGKVWTQSEIDQFAISPFKYALYRWVNGRYEYVEIREKGCTVPQTPDGFPEDLDPHAFPKGDEEIYISPSGDRKTFEWFDYLDKHAGTTPLFACYKWIEGRYRLQWDWE